MAKTIREIVKKLADGTLEYFQIGAQKLSDLENDTGFITNTVDNLTNYYTKEENYSKEEVNGLLGTVSSMKFEVIDTLPEVGNTTTIYLMNSDNEDFVGSDWFDEYIYIEEYGWERIGSAHLDLANYATKAYVDEKNNFYRLSVNKNYDQITVEEAQLILDAFLADKAIEIQALVEFGTPKIFTLFQSTDSSLAFATPHEKDPFSTSSTYYKQEAIFLTFEGNQVTNVIFPEYGFSFLEPQAYYTEPFIPTEDGQPATKKYVDDVVASLEGGEGSAPSMFLIHLTDDSYETQKETVLAAWEAYQNGENIMIATTNGDEVYYYIPHDFQYNTLTLIGTRSGLSGNNYPSESEYVESFPTYRISFDENNEISSFGVDDRNIGYGLPFLSTNQDYSEPYEPLYDGSPATKKYVDDAIANVGGGTVEPEYIRYTVDKNLSDSEKATIGNQIYEDYLAGKFIEIVYDGEIYHVAEHYLTDTGSFDKLIFKSSDLYFPAFSSKYYYVFSQNVIELQFHKESGRVTYFATRKASLNLLTVENSKGLPAYTPVADADAVPKKYVDDEIAKALSVGTKLEILESLDESQVGTEGIIYLVPNGDGTYTEYLYIAATDTVEAKWEPIGSTAIDTSALGADWAENDENAATYVQNRTHYSYEEEQVIVEEEYYDCSIMHEEDYDGDGVIDYRDYSHAWIYTDDLDTILPEGAECTITVDGEEIKQVVKSYNGTLYIGNRYIYDVYEGHSVPSEDTGEDFYIQLGTNASYVYLRIPEGETQVGATISIKGVVTKYEQLDPGYMANRIYNNLAVDKATAGEHSFAVGSSATAGENAIASGNAEASGMYSAAFGHGAEASGMYSFAAGNGEATAREAVALGSGDATANCAVAIGQYVKASSESQTAIGKNNIEDTADKYAFIIGNGTMSNTEYRSNAFTVDWNGNIWCEGTSIKIGGTSQDDSNAKEIATQEYVNEAISNVSGGAGITAVDMLPIETID